MAIGVCSVAALVIPFLGYSRDIQLYMFLGLLVILFSAPSVVSVLFQAKLKMWYIAAVNLLARFIALIGVGYMILNRGRITVLMWTSVIIALLSSWIFFWLVTKQEELDFRMDKKLILNLIRETIPIGLLLLIGGLVLKSNTILLSKLADVRAVGLYNAAYKFVDVGLILSSSLLISHLPLFSQFILSDPEKIKVLYQRSFNILALFLIPWIIFGSIFSQRIILLFSGRAYLESAFALAILLWVILLNTLNQLSVSILIAFKKQRRLLVIYTSVLLVNLAINYFGIPRYGFKVCVWASILNELLAMASLLYFCYVQLKILPSWGYSIKVALAGILAGGITLISSLPNLFLNIFFFFILFAVSAFALGILRREEIKRGWGYLLEITDLNSR